LAGAQQRAAMSVQAIHRPAWLSQSARNHFDDDDQCDQGWGESPPSSLEMTELGVRNLGKRIRKSRNIKYNLLSGSDDVLLPEGTRVTFNPKKPSGSFFEKFSTINGTGLALRLTLGKDVVADIGPDGSVREHPSAHRLLAFPRKDTRSLIIFTHSG